MKLVSVYKSTKRQQTYLYLANRDDFSPVPKPLMDMFGAPHFVMIIPLSKRKHLAAVDSEKLSQEIHDKGFYLQLPPPEESLLKQHLAEQTKLARGETND